MTTTTTDHRLPSPSPRPSIADRACWAASDAKVAFQSEPDPAKRAALRARAERADRLARRALRRMRRSPVARPLTRAGSDGVPPRLAAAFRMG